MALRRWRGVLAQEGTQTGDGRTIAPGALDWAPLPLPLGWLTQEQHGDLLAGAVQIGTITDIARTGDDVTGSGVIDDEIPEGAELIRRLEAGSASAGNRVGLSIDPDNWAVELWDTTVQESDGETADDDGLMILMASGTGPLVERRPRALAAAAGDPDNTDAGVLLMEDESGAWLERYTRLRIRGVTACAVAAFAGAYLELDGEGDAEPAPEDEAETVTAAALLRTTSAPPRFAFELPEPEPGMHDDGDLYGMPVQELLVEQPDGGLGVPVTFTERDWGWQVFGHAARWGQCFAGETEFITREGVKTLKEAVDTVQSVLVSKATGPTGATRAMEYGGRWMDAEIRAFGVQSLMKVTLRRFGQTKEVFATPEHRWVVTPLSQTTGGFRTGRRKIVTTQNLTPGARLAPLFPAKLSSRGRPTLPSPFGIAQGFVFGDGTRSDNGGTMAYFHGKKDEALLPYFPLCPSRMKSGPDGTVRRVIDNLPAYWKDLPSRHEPTQQLYGWLAGYFAADGTVSPNGLPMLFSSERGHLEFVRDICLRLGIATTGVRTFMRKGIHGVVRPLHRITLLPGTLTAEFFIGVQHRERFEARPPDMQEYTAWRVVAVEETERVEEVYCAVVPEFENFTLADNINVMNCHIGYLDECVTAPPSMAAYAHFHVGDVACADGSHISTGALTANCDHAAAHLLAPDARDHYAHSGMAFADVRATNGELGVWISGALRPSITDDQLRVLRASSLSGDWRRIGADLEFIAALAVNVPGFPIAREFVTASGLHMARASLAASAHVDNGQVMSLTASGVVQRCADCATRLRAAVREDGQGTTFSAELIEMVRRIELRTRHLVPTAAEHALSVVKRGERMTAPASEMRLPARVRRPRRG